MITLCSIPGCTKAVDVKSRGWCAMHYQRWRLNGDPLVTRKVGRKPTGRNHCSVPECKGLVKGHGFCDTHYQRWCRHGHPGIVRDWSEIEPGTRFGHLVVLRMVPDGPKRRYFCKCDCGRTTIRKGTTLRNKDKQKANQVCGSGCEHKSHNRVHEMSHTTEYRAWHNMHKRCRPVGDGGSVDYGGRGITVDSRWDNFDQFLVDMGPKPQPYKEYSLGRKDNDGPYSPENCRWETWAQQSKNTRKWGESAGSRVSRLAAERDAFREVAQLLVSGNTRTAKQRARELLDVGNIVSFP